MADNKFLKTLKENWIGGFIAIYISPIFVMGPTILSNLAKLLTLPFEVVKQARVVGDCAMVFMLIFTFATYTIGAYIQSVIKKKW